jgi:hypothetical protein
VGRKTGANAALRRLTHQEETPTSAILRYHGEQGAETLAVGRGGVELPSSAKQSASMEASNSLPLAFSCLSCSDSCLICSDSLLSRSMSLSISFVRLLLS